jgi:hypothetical protein
MATDTTDFQARLRQIYEQISDTLPDLVSRSFFIRESVVHPCEYNLFEQARVSTDNFNHIYLLCSQLSFEQATLLNSDERDLVQTLLGGKDILYDVQATSHVWSSD